MILVECQYVDDGSGPGGNYNGGWCQHMYSESEAILVARDVSIPAGSPTTSALTSVYKDGIRVARFLDGNPF